MNLRRILPILVVASVLAIASPRAGAQVIGGYVGYGAPTVVTYGSPVFVPGPIVAAPVVPVATGFPVVAPRPWIAPRPVYFGPAWGYPRAYYETRIVSPRRAHGFGPRWW
jgi:hypothetical protein